MHRADNMMRFGDMFLKCARIIALAFVASLGANLSAQDGNQADNEALLTHAADQAMQGDFSGAIASIEQYRSVATTISPAVELLDAQATYFSGDDFGAMGKLAAYFEKAEETDPSYQDALALKQDLKYVELPYLISQIPDEKLKKKPWEQAQYLESKGYQTSDIRQAAEGGNPKAMFILGAINDQWGTHPDSKINAEISYEMACFDGYQLACDYLRNIFITEIRLAFRGIDKVLSISDHKSKTARSSSGKSKTFTGKMQQQVVSRAEDICLTGEITISQMGVWTHKGYRVNESKSLADGIPLYSQERKISLRQLYNASSDWVKTERLVKTGGGAVAGFFEEWSPPYLNVQLDPIKITPSRILLKPIDTQNLNARVEQFAATCNLYMPRLEEGFKPISLRSAAPNTPPVISQPSVTPQKSSMTPQATQNASASTLAPMPNQIGQILSVDKDFGFVTVRASSLRVGEIVKTQLPTGQLINLTVAKKSSDGTYSLIPNSETDINLLQPGYPIAK